jgi:hypothetical protein
MYKPKTCTEINLNNIERLMKKVKKGILTKQETATDLNNKFARLKGQNIGMYDELYPKYIKLFKTL